MRDLMPKPRSWRVVWTHPVEWTRPDVPPDGMMEVWRSPSGRVIAWIVATAQE